MIWSVGGGIYEVSSNITESPANLPEGIVNENNGGRAENSVGIHSRCGNQCFQLGSSHVVITIALVNEIDWFEESISKENEEWLVLIQHYI